MDATLTKIKNNQIIDFNSLVDDLEICIFRSTLSQKGKFVYANSKMSELFGDINRLNVADIFLERSRFINFIERLNKSGSLKNVEVQLKAKGKKIFWGSLAAKIVKEGSGKSVYYDTVIHDISLRKEYEKELLDSKELFQTVFDNTAAAITVTDKNERIAAWNPFAQEMFGMNMRDLFNKPIKDLYPAREWKRMRALHIRQKGTFTNIETKIIRKDGSLIDVDVSISVLKDALGNVTGSIGIIRDITSQKTAERKIKESENKIRIILDNSPASIILTDSKERIVSWNKFTESLLGMKKTDLSLINVKDIYPEEEWKKIRAADIRNIGTKHHLETKVLTKSGKTIELDLSINILKNSNGEVIGSVGIMQDITNQKRFQEMLMQAKLAAEDASSAKSLFLANMSHEVRTPMNTIMGMIDLTLDTPMTEEQKENLLVAKEAADNLLSLINDILDLSRVEAGKITLENIEFHLPNVVKNVIKGLSVIARGKKLELTVDVGEKVPALLMGDPVRLRQIIINLVNNAIKFTAKGEIKTFVTLVSQKEKEVVLQFAIAYQGNGIPKDKLDSIFEAFTQADTSTTRKFGGTGLGLAISKRLVEMMGGKIWVESEVGRGSTFYFTASFVVSDSKADTSLMTGVEKEGVSDDFIKENLKGLHILLAEDNAVNQKITSKILEKQGWTVEVVDNGQTVIERVEKEKYDIVLMDSQMPIMDGLEATKQIRNNEKTTGKHVPIIALTARAMQEDKNKCFEVGMDGYVAKPIERKKLFAEIANIYKKGN